MRDVVRERVQAMTGSGGGTWEREWIDINKLLTEKQIGPALQKAMDSLSATVEMLNEELGEEQEALEKPFSAFLVKSKEIRKILHPKEDVQELVNSNDDFDAVVSLEMINDARRLLASWGAGCGGRSHSSSSRV